MKTLIKQGWWFVLVAAILAACGDDIDASKLQGSWRLKRMGGRTTSAVTSITFSGDDIVIGGVAGKFKLEGKTIKITDSRGRQTFHDIEVVSVTDTELTIRQGGAEATYERTSGGSSGTSRYPGSTGGSGSGTGSHYPTYPTP